MNRSESIQVERLDRNRARQISKARFRELDRMAQEAVAVPLESLAECLTFLRLVIGHAFDRLGKFDRCHHAKAYVGRLASGDDFRSLAKSLAHEERDRVFPPANDVGAA